jgi:hypothetical protein
MRRVRIAFFVGVLVMHTVYGYPKNRATFQSQCAANRQNVLHPLGRFVASMGKESMVAHPDSDTTGNPPQDHGNQEGFPVEEEQGGELSPKRRAA